MSDLATQYWHKICELEKKLNEALRRIEFLEVENAQLRAANMKLEERIKELEEENRRLKGMGRRFKEMIFQGDKKQEGESQRGAKPEHQASFRRKPKENEINREVDVLLKKCPSCDGKLLTSTRLYTRFNKWLGEGKVVLAFGVPLVKWGYVCSEETKQKWLS